MKKITVEENKQIEQNDIFNNSENKGMHINNKKIFISGIRNIIFVLCLILISAWGGYYIGKNNIQFFQKEKLDGAKEKISIINRTQPLDKKDIDMTMFWTVWDNLEKNFLFKENIDYEKMVYGAISGMTSALDDPYTAFFPPSQNQTSKENLNGSFYGIGIQLGYKMGDQLAVMAPLSGMPAEKAGVKAGDYILKIVDEANGIDKDTYGMNVMEAVELIRGLKGTKVKLTLMHDDENVPYEVEIVREEIITPSVEVKFGVVIDGEFIDEATKSGIPVAQKKVAQLKLSRFGDLTAKQWDESIDKILLKEKELGGIVLDLRNNPGGLMDEAVNLAAEFLPIGEVVVIQESSIEPTKTFKTDRKGRLLKMPLIVLINEGSASASEILAGALRDHSRAKIVGEKSFGKGIIQSAADFADGSGIHITIAKWLTPNGDWIHEKGIEPSVEIKLDKERPELDIQLAKAAEMVLLGN